MGKLEGKVAVVTGATSGIGKDIVEVFVEEGAKVVFCGRREEKGRAFEEELREKGYDVKFVRADTTVETDLEQLLSATLDTYGKVDVLVNNAGVLKMFSVLDIDLASDYDAVFNVNLRAYFATTKIFGRVMKPGSAIVNTASIGGLGGCPNLSTYGASKAGVISLTESAGKELAPKGIRVNAVCPGTIFSEMMPEDGEFTKGTLAGIPMARGGQPREIGTVVAFLASEEASYVTGQAIVVDGGFTA